MYVWSRTKGSRRRVVVCIYHPMARFESCQKRSARIRLYRDKIMSALKQAACVASPPGLDLSSLSSVLRTRLPTPFHDLRSTSHSATQSHDIRLERHNNNPEQGTHDHTASLTPITRLFWFTSFVSVPVSYVSQTCVCVCVCVCA